MNSTYADFSVTTYTPSATNRTIRVQLSGGTVATGLHYVIFKGTNISTAEFVAQGTNANIDGAGIFTLNVTNSSLMIGDNIIAITANFQGIVNELSRSAYIVGTIVEV